MQPVLMSYNKKYAPKVMSPELNFQIAGRVLAEEVPGMDTIKRVCALAEAHGISLYQLPKDSNISMATIKAAGSSRLLPPS